MVSLSVKNEIKTSIASSSVLNQGINSKLVFGFTKQEIEAVNSDLDINSCPDSVSSVSDLINCIKKGIEEKNQKEITNLKNQILEINKNIESNANDWNIQFNLILDDVENYKIMVKDLEKENEQLKQQIKEKDKENQEKRKNEIITRQFKEIHDKMIEEDISIDFYGPFHDYLTVFVILFCCLFTCFTFYCFFSFLYSRYTFTTRKF